MEIDPDAQLKQGRRLAKANPGSKGGIQSLPPVAPNLADN